MMTKLGAPQKIYSKERSFVRDQIPRTASGIEIYTRFQNYAFRSNPQKSPMARALVAHGYEVSNHPLYPQYTDTDWLASHVSMRGLSIVFRQPTEKDLLVCYIKREGEHQNMRSSLLGIAQFFSCCRYDCPDLRYVGGHLEKQNNDIKMRSPLTMDRLISFYHHHLGDLEAYQRAGTFFIYAELHRDQRFEHFPLWKKCR